MLAELEHHGKISADDYVASRLTASSSSYILQSL